MLASCRVCLWLLPVTPWLAVSSGQEEVSRFQPDSAKTPVSITSRTCSFSAENKAEGIGRRTMAHPDSIANRWGGACCSCECVWPSSRLHWHCNGARSRLETGRGTLENGKCRSFASAPNWVRGGGVAGVTPLELLGRFAAALPCGGAKGQFHCSHALRE